MKLLKITERVYNEYLKVKDNENVDFEMARKKINRNILLANRVVKEKEVVAYFYGRLLIKVKDDTIVFLKNKAVRNNSFIKDMDRFNELNELLGISNGLNLEL